MTRLITILVAMFVLVGCVSTHEVVYRERYNASPYYEGGYADGQPYYDEYGEYNEYAEPGTYYTPSASSAPGSYYYGTSYSSYGVSYFDYPVYYSVFWPINRWYYDPFVYPGYHYGVTWFPRSYLSIGIGGGWGSFTYLSYSPYRYAWVDNYYDWGRWYNRYPTYRNYYPTPRYGSARVEANRLADLRRPASPRNNYANRNLPMRTGSQAPAYSGSRLVDYGGNPSQAQKNAARDDVRRVNAGANRLTPREGLFGNPASSNNPRQATPRSGQAALPRSNTSSGTRGELGRVGNNLQNGSAMPRSNSSNPAPVRQVQDTPRATGLRPATQAPVNTNATSARGSESIRNAQTPARAVGTQRPAATQESIPMPVRSSTPATRTTTTAPTAVRSAPAPVRTPVQPARPAAATPSAPLRTAPVQNRAAPVATPAPARNVAPAPVRNAAPAVRAPAVRAPESAPARPTTKSSSSSVRRVGSNRRD